MPDTFLNSKHAEIVGTRRKKEHNPSLIGFHKVWLSWHLNEPCIWGNNPPPVSWSRKQKHLQLCASVCVSVYVCIGNTEVTVVFVPAVRMLSLPTALFHSPPLCFCLLVYVCRHIMLLSEVPAASASLVAKRTDPVWRRHRGLLVRRCKSTGSKFFIWMWFTQINCL